MIGLDFDNYDRQEKVVPVYVMGEGEAKVLSKAEGKKFKRGYESSGLGEAIMVTFTSPSGRGWFKLKWGLEEGRVKREEGI